MLLVLVALVFALFSLLNLWGYRARIVARSLRTEKFAAMAVNEKILGKAFPEALSN